MAPFPESAVVTLPVPAKQLLDLQESTAFRTLLAQARLHCRLAGQCAALRGRKCIRSSRTHAAGVRQGAAGPQSLQLRSGTYVTSWY